MTSNEEPVAYGRWARKMQQLQAEINAAGMGDPRDAEITRLRAENERLPAIEEAAKYVIHCLSDPDSRYDDVVEVHWDGCLKDLAEALARDKCR